MTPRSYPREDQLRWTTLDEVTAAAKEFLDPVVAGEREATWAPGHMELEETLNTLVFKRSATSRSLRARAHRAR